MSIFYALVSLGACLLVLCAEYRQSQSGKWLFKPLAAAAFIALALQEGAPDSQYGQWILLGLCLSWCGDVLLIPKNNSRAFLMGIASFLLAHVAYCLAFLNKGVDTSVLIYSGFVFVLAAGLLLRWLWPHLRGFFKTAVTLYVVVIMTMVMLALAGYLQTGLWMLLAGAIGFACSDLAVARERFIQKSIVNRLWGLPLYFGSQCLLAYSVSL